jgi:hypothetical protein
MARKPQVDPATTKKLIELLKQGKVEEFNQSRPRGRHPRSSLDPTEVTYLYELDLSEQDFSGLDLRGVNLGSAILRWTNFSDADLRDASFDCSDISGAKFDRALTRGACFRRAGERSQWLSYEILAVELGRQERIGTAYHI